MTNKAKFLALVSEDDHAAALDLIRWRIKNRELLRVSQKIALQVLMRLDKLHWNQKDLAREMGISYQQVSKIVSGKEEIELATQVKLQALLGISIIECH